MSSYSFSSYFSFFSQISNSLIIMNFIFFSFFSIVIKLSKKINSHPIEPIFVIHTCLRFTHAIKTYLKLHKTLPRMLISKSKSPHNVVAFIYSSGVLLLLLLLSSFFLSLSIFSFFFYLSLSFSPTTLNFFSFFHPKMCVCVCILMYFHSLCKLHVCFKYNKQLSN